MDFRRYLPRDVVISREEHDEALDQFFRYHASWGKSVSLLDCKQGCGLINISFRLTRLYLAGQQTHPVHFRTDMQLSLSPAATSHSSSSARARTAHYSPMLHNAILSIGLRFLSHSSSHCNHDLSSLDTLRKFSDEAKKHMRTEGMNPSVATVQALAHLASHHNLMAEHNLGWLQIGMAVRCGLTREFTSGVAFEMVMHRSADNAPYSYSWAERRSGAAGAERQADRGAGKRCKYSIGNFGWRDSCADGCSIVVCNRYRRETSLIG
jgi:hypothetical protein